MSLRLVYNATAAAFAFPLSPFYLAALRIAGPAYGGPLFLVLFAWWLDYCHGWWPYRVLLWTTGIGFVLDLPAVAGAAAAALYYLAGVLW